VEELERATVDMAVNNDSIMYDVLIVGAGPAGATAAAICAEKGLSVCLMDRRTFSETSHIRVWANAAIRPLIEACGLDASRILGPPIRTLTFCSADLSRRMTSQLARPLVHVIERSRLEGELVRAAVSAGVTLRTGQAVTGVEILEEQVNVSLADGSSARGRFLIGADGAKSLVGRQIGLLGTAEPPCWCAQWDVHLGGGTKRKTAEDAPAMIVVLGLIQTQGIGYILSQADHLLVGVAGPSNPQEIAEHFDVFVTDAGEAGLLPEDIRPAQPAVWPTPAGQAIEMDAHVGKRSLLVGEAGGFVAAISYEGIYPAMWSASIAAGVIADADSADSPQDVLGEFESRWRVAMADYIRMPNTDAQFLLPLIFTNQQIADRMAASFLSGGNI